VVLENIKVVPIKTSQSFLSTYPNKTRLVFYQRIDLIRRKAAIMINNDRLVKGKG
jgi:hypothetical protein